MRGIWDTQIMSHHMTFRVFSFSLCLRLVLYFLLFSDLFLWDYIITVNGNMHARDTNIKLKSRPNMAYQTTHINASLYIQLSDHVYISISTNDPYEIRLDIQ